MAFNTGHGNTSNTDIVDKRRELVGMLRLRGFSSRKIAQTLATGGEGGKFKLLNPQTGEPYSHVTIKHDIDALKAEWRESASAAIDEHQARQLAEIQEVKQMAWAQRNGGLALAAIDKEMKLLGTAKEFNGIMVNFNIKMETIYQIAELAPQQGLKASDLFETMLRKLQHAQD